MTKASCNFIRKVTIQEIQCYKIPVRSAIAGQTCSIAINVNSSVSTSELYDSIKKGTVVIDHNEPPTLTYEFLVKLNLCNTSEEATVKANHEPVVFSETFKQSCYIEEYKKNPLKLIKTISKSKDTIDLKVDSNMKRSKSQHIDKVEWTKILKQTAPDIRIKPNCDNIVVLRFKFRPEYVKLGQKIVIYDYHIKATGVVSELFN